MGCYLRNIFLLMLLVLVVDHYRVLGQNLQYLGCFDLTYALSQSLHHHHQRADVTQCAFLCTHLAKTQVGIEKSDNFCYCGNDIAEESMRRADSMCSVSCSGNNNYTCGGDYMMSVYSLLSRTTTYPTKDIYDPGSGTGSGVGFLLGLSTGTRFYKSNRMPSFDTLMNTTDWVYNVDYHFTKNFAFAYLKEKLLRSSLSSKTPFQVNSKVIKVMLSNKCEGFAVDWLEDRIYYTECIGSGVQILSMDLEGKNVTEVITRPDDSVAIKRMVIDPYTRKLFWTADGVIESCDLSGNNFITNVSAEGVTVRALTLDLESHRVFYIGSLNSSASLFSMDYQGENSILHYSTQQMSNVYGLGVFKEFVYWINYSARDILYKGPRTKNRTLAIQVLSSIDRAVWHMRLVHPDLQKRPTRYTCPAGLKLDQNTKDCVVMALTASVRSTSSSLFVGLLSLFLIAVGILIAVSLVYFGDKYWSSLRSRLPGIPYSREKGKEEVVTSEYHVNAAEDNVRLV